jgi:uncharacterized protein (DUF58 family)
MATDRSARRKARAAAARAKARPSYDLSLNGFMFLCLTVFMMLAALNSQANLLFGVGGLMIGILLVSFSISRLVLMRLSITRVLPDHAVVGRQVTLQYEVANEKSYWSSLSVTIAELDGADAFTRPPLAYMLHAAPKTTAVVPTELIPKRRGLHTFDRYQVSTSFPFGFVKRAATRRHKDALLVYPAIGQVDPKLLLRFQAAERSGAMLRPRRGGQDEFYGVKEFRRGENPRWIHWKRSARTGTLVVKEMTLVSPPRLALFVDTFVAAADHNPAAASRVEQTIAMAGSLASHALEAGLMVGLYAWTADGWILLQPNRGKRHGRDLMAALARLPDNPVHQVQDLMARGEELLKSGTTPVLLTPREVDVGLSERSRGGVVVLSPATPAGRAAIKFDPAIQF